MFRKDGNIKIFNHSGAITMTIEACPTDITSVAYMAISGHVVVSTHDKR
jgi:hypothetical protein